MVADNVHLFHHMPLSLASLWTKKVERKSLSKQTTTTTGNEREKKCKQTFFNSLFGVRICEFAAKLYVVVCHIQPHFWTFVSLSHIAKTLHMLISTKLYQVQHSHRPNIFYGFFQFNVPEGIVRLEPSSLIKNVRNCAVLVFFPSVSMQSAGEANNELSMSIGCFAAIVWYWLSLYFSPRNLIHALV